VKRNLTILIHPAPNSLQLNIGIIAACASFLKPLLGRLLKINSTIGYSYPSNQYNRSGRTPAGAETIGSGYPAKRRRGRSEVDEFELHTKNDGHRDKDHQVVTSVQALRSRGVTSPDHSSTDAVDAPQSDANSEEIILQKTEPAHGIMISRDVSVRYTNK
jgi:hypothetical protein